MTAAARKAPTFLELGEDVMRQRKDDGIRGLSREWSRWRCHVATAPFTSKRVDEIETIDILAWTRDLAQKECTGYRAGQRLSRGTVQRSLSLVSAVMAEALVRGHVKSNVCFGVQVKKRADEASTKEKWTYFTLEEEQAIAGCVAIPEADRLAILFALYTGLRQGEQFNLELVDVHLDGAPRVVVRYGSFFRLPPKSGKIRTVHLIPRAVDVTRRWLELLPEYARENPDGLVFPTARGRRRQQGKPLGRSDVFRKHLAAAGIEKHARWHDLRHGCASALVGGWWGRKYSMNEARDVLGHSSVVVTERYQHAHEEVLREAARETTTAVEIPPEVRPEPPPMPSIRDAAVRVAFDLARRFVGRMKVVGNA